MMMKIKYLFLVPIVVLIIVFSCNKKDTSKPGEDSILEGKVSILVDESLMPIIEDQALVFENQYNAKLTLLPKSEKESMLDFVKDSSKILVLSRKLTKKEEQIFKQKKIVPRVTGFAIDAIALIRNKKSKDTLIDLKEVISYLKGEQSSIKGLVFDNPNSSSVRYFKELASIENLPEKGVFSFKTNDDVVKYVSENDGLIGVVGINWLTQPKPEMNKYIENLNVLSVKSEASNQYVYPHQVNIGSKKYPLARDLYIINCQGYEGLGIGFASFIAGEDGQRIILKSGLAPLREPSRNIRVRKQIEIEKK